MLVSTVFFAFTISIENQRTIEGKVLNDNTQTPITTEIILTRQRQTQHIKSTAKGWYSITLPADKAYAVKIYHKEYKKYINAIFLEEKTTSESFKYDITLTPGK